MKRLLEEIYESEAGTKRLRKYKPEENMEIYEETALGGDLKWDYGLYLEEQEQSSWDGKFLGLDEHEQREHAAGRTSKKQKTECRSFKEKERPNNNYELQFNRWEHDGTTAIRKAKGLVNDGWAGVEAKPMKAEIMLK